MLKILRNLLEQLINDIDSGNSNINKEQELEIVQFIQKFTSKELSKLEAADYLGISRATFDNYVHNGWIPKGTKRMGFKELSWRKCDLDKFKEK